MTQSKSFFNTKLGQAFNGEIEEILSGSVGKALKGKVDLILTSPPFPLLSPKNYGNLQGEVYLNWLTKITSQLTTLLSPRGSMVIEIGNSWNSKSPTMSTLPLRTLLSIADSGSLKICQQLIWHNPAKLPGPAAWVTVKRKRLTDSFTHVWWYSPHEDPYADNSKVLQPYTKAMEKLLSRQSYNAGKRPSGHEVSKKGFLADKGGSIARSVLSYSNTSIEKAYRDWCIQQGVAAHPARMPVALAEFFVKFLTKKNGLVMDPFAGSCTTGLAAESLARRWVCVERNKEYLIGARGRFIHSYERRQKSKDKSP